MTRKFTLTLPPELSFAATGLATVEYTTVAAICRRALDDYLSRRGYLGELDEAEESDLLSAAGMLARRVNDHDAITVNDRFVGVLGACGLLANRTVNEAVLSLIETIEAN